MASIINATTTNGVAITPDNSGELRLQTNNGTTAVTIDTSQNVGVGTTSPSARLTVGRVDSSNEGGQIDLCRSSDNASAWAVDVYGNTSTPAFRIIDNVATAERMRIDSSGNVGIGTGTITSSAGWSPRLVLAGADTALIVKGSSGQESSFGTSGGLYLDCLGNSTGANNNIVFRNTSTNSSYSASERMRITSSGHVLIGTTDTSTESGIGFKYIPSTTAPYTGVVKNTDSNSTEWHLYNTNATNNGYRFYVGANGGIYNYSGNNVNISDERTKENIELAGNYLDKICSIPVKTFNYKDEPTGEQKTLGVIAQDVETIAPEFVNNDGWKGTEPEDGVPLKTIYTTDMMFGLMKAIQELKAQLDESNLILTSVKTELDTVKAELNTLKNPPVEGTE